jgi:hypothetical protein
MSKKQDDAINALDAMLHNLKKPKMIPYKEVVIFYQKLEEIYDDKLEELEKILMLEIDDEEKFEQLKKISELLEVNIF